MSQRQYTLAELAELFDMTCVGNPETKISGLATLSSAGAGQLSFVSNAKYLKDLETTAAEAVIVAADMVEACPSQCLVSSNPYLSYARVSQLFAEQTADQGTIHPSAVIHSGATVAESATICANVTIADGVSIAANSIVSPGCVIGRNTVLGEYCLLHANVTLYHGISVGDRAIIHSATVIGSDGFGFAPSPDKEKGGWVKIAQLGGVRIGDDVEIGSGTTIDRGALDDTIIADRVIIDNQVHIAHNVQIGENTGIAGCVGIAGSTIIGKNCTFAGGVCINGHLTIADNVHLTGMTMVTNSIKAPGLYSSGIRMSENKKWLKNAVRFSQLDDMARRLAALEKSK